MELEQEEFGQVALLEAQVLMEKSDEKLLVERSDGVEEAVGVAEYGSELGSSIVAVVVPSDPLTEPTELVTELETVGLSDHLHKIDQIAQQVEVE